MFKDEETQRIEGERAHSRYGDQSVCVEMPKTIHEAEAVSARLTAGDIDHYVRRSEYGDLSVWCPKDYALEARTVIKGPELNPDDHLFIGENENSLGRSTGQWEPSTDMKVHVDYSAETQDRGPDYMPTAQERVDARFNDLMAERARMDPDLLADLGAQAEREFRMSGMAVDPHFRSDRGGMVGAEVMTRNFDQHEQKMGEEMHRNFGKWSTPVLENLTSNHAAVVTLELNAALIDSYTRIAEDGRRSVYVPTDYAKDASIVIGRDFEKAQTVKMERTMGRSR